MACQIRGSPPGRSAISRSRGHVHLASERDGLRSRGTGAALLRGKNGPRSSGRAVNPPSAAGRVRGSARFWELGQQLVVSLSTIRRMAHPERLGSPHRQTGAGLQPAPLPPGPTGPRVAWAHAGAWAPARREAARDGRDADIDAKRQENQEARLRPVQLPPRFRPPIGPARNSVLDGAALRRGRQHAPTVLGTACPTSARFHRRAW